MPNDIPAVKILFVGDMHLGRRASRIPENALALAGCSLADIGPQGAWERVVEAAIAQKVDAVAFAGDLVHHADDIFEAKALLEVGVQKLKAAGIAVVAVAGNHDTLVLPALADLIDDLHLLGPGATWSTFDVTPEVRIAGWSFPTRHHSASPLLQDPPPPQSGITTIGLLHADLDVAASDYAPVSSRELLDVGYDGWALGHIHKPDPEPSGNASNTPFYLGSITGAIPTETGIHGPVLATVSPGLPVVWKRLPIAPLRWENIHLDASHYSTDVRLELLAQISELELDEAWQRQNTRMLALRVSLTGIHPRAAEIARVCDQFSEGKTDTINDGRVVFIERVTCELRVPFDLTNLAKQPDPPGLIARQILALQQNDTSSHLLVADARLAIEAIAQPNGLDQELWSDLKIREHLITAGQHSLNTLLSQDRGDAS